MSQSAGPKVLSEDMHRELEKDEEDGRQGCSQTPKDQDQRWTRRAVSAVVRAATPEDRIFEFGIGILSIVGFGQACMATCNAVRVDSRQYCGYKAKQ